MAHLRDAKTGELLAEGTPQHIVLVADELKLKAGVVGIGETAEGIGLDLVFDDVGLGFDPAAIRRARAENLEGLTEAAKVEKDKTAKASLTAAHKEHVADGEAAKPAAQKAKKVLDKARARIKE